jgi:hypothetical protein
MASISSDSSGPEAFLVSKVAIMPEPPSCVWRGLWTRHSLINVSFLMAVIQCQREFTVPHYKARATYSAISMIISIKVGDMAVFPEPPASRHSHPI